MEVYTFQLTNDGARIEEVQEELQGVLTATGVRLKSVYAVNLALGEWLENIIQHSMVDSAEPRIDLECELAGRDLCMRVRDSGKPFDPTQFPLTAPEPDKVFAPRGLSLIRKVVDSWSYQRLDGHNVLELRKQIARNEN